MGEKTSVTKASSKFESLRTTIPMSFVRQWELQEGDALDWSWEARTDSDGPYLIAVVTKVGYRDHQNVIKNIWPDRRSP